MECRVLTSGAGFEADRRMRFALLACLSSLLISCTNSEDEEGSVIRYDIKSYARFDRLEIELDGDLAERPTFAAPATEFHFERADVLGMYYTYLDVTAYAADAPVAGTSLTLEYYSDGRLRIAAGTANLHSLEGD